MKLAILGCGYSCRRFVELHGGSFERIAGTSRNPESLTDLLWNREVSSPARSAGPRDGDPESPARPKLLGSRPLADARPGTTQRNGTFIPLAFDGSEVSVELRQELGSATHLLVSIPPGEGGDNVLPGVAEVAMPHLRWIGYLSTVGVYGDAGGAWIDESAPLRAASRRNLRRVNAELGWTAFADGRETPLQIFRLAGIYGPGRSALSALRDGTARRIVKPGQVFNRIHVDDIAGAIAAGIVRSDLTGPINVADDEPAPPQDVVAHAARLLGLEPPPPIAFQEADLTDMARSFYSANKRVSNRRLKEDFGYELAFPTYREGLKDALDSEA